MVYENDISGYSVYKRINCQEAAQAKGVIKFNMTRQCQKDIEVFYAEQFANSMNFKWKVEVPPDELAYPDLLIIEKNSKFGLEVRELVVDEGHKGSQLKGKENHHFRLVENLALTYYKSSQKPIYVKIFGPIDKINFDKILNCLIDNDVKQNQVVSKRINTPLGRLTLSITGLPPKFHNYSNWRCTSDNIGFVKLIDNVTLGEIISEKSLKITKYSKNIKIVSLLLYCTPLYNSGKFNFNCTDELKKHGFKNLYLYEHPIRGYQY